MTEVKEGKLFATKQFNVNDVVIIYSSKSIPKSEVKDPVGYPFVMGDKVFFAEGDAMYIQDPMPAELCQMLNYCCSVEAVQAWITTHEKFPGNVFTASTSDHKIILVAEKEIKIGDPINLRFKSAYWLDRTLFQPQARPRARLSCLLVLIEMGKIPMQLPPVIPIVGPTGELAHCKQIDAEFETKDDEATIKKMQEIFGFEGSKDAWFIENFICRGIVPAPLTLPLESLKRLTGSCCYCGAPKKLQCGKCGAIYCDAICQKKHWPIHKPMCKK